MSQLAILKDAARAPGLFLWNGPIAADCLREWLRQHELESGCPTDLVRLWQQTGGGDFFETETILGPFGNSELGDDVLGQNDFLRAQGLAEHLLVFCTGAFIGAVDTKTAEYVHLNSTSFQPHARYASLDAWYLATERAEFAERYGIS